MQIVNLSNLEAMTDGDKEFMQDMIDTYLHTVPEMISDLLNASKQNDLETAKSRAHKLKSSMGLMGMHSTLEVLDKIELSVLQKEKTESIPDWVTIVVKDFEKSVEDLS